VAATAKPPVEVVLPLAYYLILVAEAAGLSYLYATHDVTAGGTPGHLIGWVGTASMLLMHVYSIRRRVRALSHWGKLSTWLHVHIFLGLQGAMLVTFHSAHLVTVSNISGATIICTLVVVASGMFGRYLFSLLPKGVSGQRLTVREIEGEIEELKQSLRFSAHPTIEAALKEHAECQPITGKMGVGALIKEDLRARRAVKLVEQALKQVVLQPKPDGEKSDLELFAAGVRRRAFLARRLALLQGAERMFRNWHILHKPLTFILFGVVVLHIVSHYIYAAQFSG
jgi:hypothetical protein